MSSKLLYHVLEKKLLLGEEPQSLKEFVTSVVEDYLEESRQQGFEIQFSLKAELCEELEESVRDMTLKKIYGSLSIGEYRKRFLKK